MAPEPQTDRELAEMVAKFRTPPGFDWSPLADDIETILKARPKPLSRNKEALLDVLAGKKRKSYVS